MVKALGFWQRLAVAVWSAAFAGVVAHLLWSPTYNGVYPVYALAARNWLAGKNLYEVHPGLDSYRYSPLVACLLVPFSMLPDCLAGIVWRLINLAAYLMALNWWTRAVLPAHLSRTQRAILFLLVVPLSLSSVHNGQCNPLLAGLLLATTAAAAQRQWNLAAGSAAFAAWIKFYPISLGLLLAAAYPRRFAGRLAIAVGMGLALPFLLQQPAYVAEQYRACYHFLGSYDRQVLDRQGIPPDLRYRDLRLLCRVWLVPLSPAAYRAIQLSLAAIVAALCIAARRAGWPRRRLLLLVSGLSCCWMTLVGPATESATYILLAPSLAWAIMESWLERWSPTLQTGLLASVGLFWVTQVGTWFPWGKHYLHEMGLHALAALLLLICLVASMKRSMRSERQDRAVGQSPLSLAPGPASLTVVGSTPPS